MGIEPTSEAWEVWFDILSRDNFRVADQADKNLCDSPLILDCPRAVMGP
jgi:hypothetical protein